MQHFIQFVDFGFDLNIGTPCPVVTEQELQPYICLVVAVGGGNEVTAYPIKICQYLNLLFHLPIKFSAILSTLTI